MVVGTLPGQVLQLLSDPTEKEVSRFEKWKNNHVTSVIHSDTSFYDAFDIQKPSAFDFFQSKSEWGYNAYLNDLCQVNSDLPYFLSYKMSDFIDTEKVVHIQKHTTPFYSSESFKTRDEIINTNGENRTFYVGAYLGDGLHEGSTISADRVAQQFGSIPL